jgi:hypothetical protein
VADDGIYIARFDTSGIVDEFSGKNPVPYTRATQRQKWTPSVKRYHRWCNALRECFASAAPMEPAPMEGVAHFGEVNYYSRKTPPIVLHKEQKRRVIVTVETCIVWADEAHADADNVHKGVLDSLFTNDKLVNRHHIEADYTDDDTPPGLTVHITIHGRS